MSENNLLFATIVPHPPIILPYVGSEEDRKKVDTTISKMSNLGKVLREKNPGKIIISSPHQDWGFDVPLFFLAKNFKKEILTYLTDTKDPQYYFEKGKDFYESKISKEDSKTALIASGDLSHRLKEDGPYGFHESGPDFDKELITSLKNKNIENILILDKKYPQAGECGLRSISFLLGVLESRLEKTNKDYVPEILSYEAPFGVGYLVANFRL